jgi:TM2 domain-containing membrane protein YozV
LHGWTTEASPSCGTVTAGRVPSDAMDKTSAKDPAIASVLAVFVPGLGHLYAGKPGAFVVFLVLGLWLASAGHWLAFAAVHLFQIVAAGGAAKMWNQQHGFVGGVAVPPPPPATRRSEAPQPAAPPPPPPPLERAAAVQSPPGAFDAAEFLEELQTAWREHRQGARSAREFADRKWRAIRGVRVDGPEEGEALVLAAKELASEGVLTSEEVEQLQRRVGA